MRGRYQAARRDHVPENLRPTCLIAPALLAHRGTWAEAANDDAGARGGMVPLVRVEDAEAEEEEVDQAAVEEDRPERAERGLLCKCGAQEGLAYKGVAQSEHFHVYNSTVLGKGVDALCQKTEFRNGSRTRKAQLWAIIVSKEFLKQPKHFTLYRLRLRLRKLGLGQVMTRQQADTNPSQTDTKPS